MKLLKFFLSGALLLLLVSCVSNTAVDVQALERAQINNFSAPESLVFASGQPTQEQFPVMAQAGIKHVISLRTEGELDWDEAALAKSQGIQFHSISVSGRDGVTSENAQTLETLLQSLDGQPVLLHCGSSNRVGALKAVTARDGGASIEEALTEGRRWGLTGMEQRVRDVLTAAQ